MYYINQDLVDLNRIFDQNKREGFLRLDLNENPDGLDPEFIKEVLSDVGPEFVSQYPETLEFTESLAKHHGTDIEHICLVNGSSEGIRQIIEAFSSPGGRIVGVSPSYAMFEVYSKMYGRNFVPVSYTESLEMPVENILAKLTEDTELLILLNPNNPMGNVYTEEEMKILIREAQRKEITVLIDEAYIGFYPNSFIEYGLKEKYVFVTRTFSKLFSLAGCRLGYVVGWPEGIALVQKLCTPHNVNAFAMKFAKAILDKEGYLDKLINIQLDGKAYLIESLKERGYRYNAKEGNFIFIQPKTDAAGLMRRMKEEKKILIKTYPNVGDLGTCLRVTTGPKKCMERFLEAMKELDA